MSTKTNRRKILLALLTIILFSVLISAPIANAIESLDPLPPPPSNNSEDLPEKAMSRNDFAPQLPPPIINPTLNNAPPPILNHRGPLSAPIVPSEGQLREEAMRELWHVYREYNETVELIKYALKIGISVNVDDFISYAITFYGKALNMYNNKEYVESKAYAHLAIEALHGAKDIVRYQLAINGVIPPPPPPLPPLLPG